MYLGRTLLLLLVLCGSGLASSVDEQMAAVAHDPSVDDLTAGDGFVNEEDVPKGLPPLEEEHGYFASIDLDKDGIVNPSEFQKHLQRATALDLSEHDIDDMYAKNLTLGMTVGKVWVELHGSDSHDAAFAEIDANGDKKLTWDEWIHEMFHDQPQVRPEKNRWKKSVLKGLHSCTSHTCTLRRRSRYPNLLTRS